MKRPSNKNILLILSLFLIFMIIGTATAADDSLSNDDGVLTVDNSTVSDDIVSTDTSENTDQLSEGDSDTGTYSDTNDEILGDEPSGTSFTDLQNYIDTASNGSTINLNHDYKFVPEDFRTVTVEDDGENKSEYYNYTGVVIKQNNLIIDGNGRVLDASNLARVFIVEGENVTIKNIKFINSNPREVLYSNVDYNKTTDHLSDRKGGAIYWHGGGNGYLNNCSFDNCTANPIMNYGANNSAGTMNGVGGAVYIWSVNGLRIDDCIFNKCHSNYGAILINSGSQNIIVCNSTFINCTGVDTYGAFGGLNSKNLVFAYNTLINSCLELWINNASVSNCVFNNSAVKLAHEGVVIKDSNFTDYNKTKPIIDIPQNNCKLSGLNFDNCNTTSLIATRVLGNNLNVLNCTGTNCNCSGDVISINQNGGNVADCTFTNCTSSNSIISIGGKNGNVEGCTLSNCTASDYLVGGKGDFDINNIKYVNSTVLNNPFYTFMLNALSQGNTVKLNQSFNVSAPYLITESNVVIDGNGFNLTGKSGIYTVKGNNVTFKNIAFVNATTSLNINGENGTVDNCTFINCTGTGSLPSAIYMKNGHISNSKFINSTGSYNDGMVVYNNGGIIENCSFTNCSPSSQANTNVLCEIAINCTFDNCMGYGFGGSLKTNQVYNSTFKDCTGSTINKNWVGGVVYLTGNNPILDNCSFINCDSYEQGYIGFSSNATISNCIFGKDDDEDSILKVRDGSFTINIDNCTTLDRRQLLRTANSDVVFNIRDSHILLNSNGWFFDKSTIINSTLLFRMQGDIKNSVIINSTIGRDNSVGTNKIVNSCIISTTLSKMEQMNNWYGSNNPQDVNDYLELHVDQVDELIKGEWLSALDIYFVKHGTNERFDVLWTRNVTLTIVSGEAVVQNTTTGKHGKIYTNKTNNVTVRVAVDNYTQDFTFGVTNNTGFTELQSLINGADKGETLVINNNYTFNPENDIGLENGIIIDKPISLDLNGSTINGNDTKNPIFNITSNDVNIENGNIKNVNGSAIISTGNNTSINNLKAENINGTVIDIIGNNAIVSDVVANSGEGIVVNIKGDYPSVRNITSDRQGQLIYINGKGAEGSLNIIIGDITYLDNVQANVTSLVDGVYIININGKQYPVTVKDGKGTVTITDVLDAKQYNATIQSNMASYDVSANTTFTVNNAKIIDLRISVDNVAYPNKPIAVINTNVDGEYIVNINGKPYTVTVKDGKGNVTLDLLPVDTYTVIVMSNVSNYDVVSNSTSFSIVNGTISELNVIADSVTYPDTGIVLVSASVDGIYNVNVNGTDYPVHVTNGVGNIVLPVLPVGKYNVTVTGKIKNYNLVNKTVLLSVKADTNATVTVPEIVEGRNNTQMPINLPSDAKGNVVLMVDGESVDTKELVNGSAILNIPELTPGEHNISVVYSGDDKYAGFNKTSGIKTKKESNATVNVPTNIEAGKTTTIPIRLPADAKGNVTLMVDGKAVDTKELVNGSAVLTVPAQSAGKHDISVVYSGDDKYATFIKTTNVDVKSPVPAKKATVITPAKKKYTFKKSKRSKTKTFKVTLKEKIGGKKLSGKTVLFKLTNVNKIKLTNKVKKAIKKANAKVKKAKIAVKKAKGKAAKAKAKKKLAKAKKALTKAKKPQTMLKQLKKGKYAVKTNKDGVAKLTLSNKNFVMEKFRGKNIKLTAKFNGDSSYLKSGKTVKVVIK